MSDPIEQLSSDLPHLDKAKALELYNKLGARSTARIFGYEVNHYDNLVFSGRLLLWDVKRTMPSTTAAYVEAMGERLAPNIAAFMLAHANVIDMAIKAQDHRDLDVDWFSANTQVSLYLAKKGFKSDPVEPPQFMHMRLAVQHYYDEGIGEVLEMFYDLSEQRYTPASPTIFNAGTPKPQMSSCFLYTIGDNLESILYRGAAESGMISKCNGGLGFDISNIRHSEIGADGMSAGIIPMLQVYNDIVRYVDQGGKRKGAATVFLRPHHIDVFDFISLVDKVGDRYARAHDINIALWVPWLFWKRVRENGDWTLFCPAKTKELNDVWGLEFEKRYIAAEARTDIPAHARRTVKARELYEHIVTMQSRTGMPYIMHADACNMKSNHRHMGYIRCANLCLEIVEFTDEDNISSCNLSSMSLRHFARAPITATEPTEADIRAAFDFQGAGRASQRITRNLNKIIDFNYYPLDKKRAGGVKPGKINKTNKRNRPVGQGVSGFAEALAIMDLAFEDPATFLFNRMLFACLYFNSMLASVQLAIKDGAYETFAGSPLSQGKFQFDLWREEFQLKGPNPSRKAEDDEPVEPSAWGQTPFILYKDRQSIDVVQPTWADLRRVVMRYGVRNSLLMALMPTASTAQTLRNGESVEQHQSNMYSRRVLNCSYPVINRYLMRDLAVLNLMNDSLVAYLQAANGSIAQLHEYVRKRPDLFLDFTGDYARLARLQVKYRTMWEISQKVFLRQAADRGRYVCSSASTNIYLKEPTNEQLTALHLYTDDLGNKTGMYYLRQDPAAEIIKFTVDASLAKYVQKEFVSVQSDGAKKTKPAALVSSAKLDWDSVPRSREEDPKAPLRRSGKVACTDDVCISCQ